MVDLSSFIDTDDTLHYLMLYPYSPIDIACYLNTILYRIFMRAFDTLVLVQDFHARIRDSAASLSWSRKPRPPSPATTLPPELLLHIFTCLRHRDTHRMALLRAGSVGACADRAQECGHEHAAADLRACVLTCRAWRAPATDVLYRALRPRDERTWELLARTLVAGDAGGGTLGLAARVGRVDAPPVMRCDRLGRIREVVRACGAARHVGLVVAWSGALVGVQTPAVHAPSGGTSAIRSQKSAAPPSEPSTLPARITSLTLDAIRHTMGGNVVPLAGRIQDTHTGVQWRTLRLLELRNLSWCAEQDFSEAHSITMPCLRTLSIAHCSFNERWINLMAQAAPNVTSLALVDVSVARDEGSPPSSPANTGSTDNLDTARVISLLSSSTDPAEGTLPGATDFQSSECQCGWSESLRSLTLVRVLQGIPGDFQALPPNRTMAHLHRLNDLTVDVEALSSSDLDHEKLSNVRSLRVVWRVQVPTKSTILTNIGAVHRMLDALFRSKRSAAQDGRRRRPACLQTLEVCAYVTKKTWRWWQILSFLLHHSASVHGVKLRISLCMTDEDVAEFRRRRRRNLIIRRLLFQY